MPANAKKDNLELLDGLIKWGWKLGGFLLILWIMGNLFTGPFQHWFIFRPKKLPQDFRYQFAIPAEELWIKSDHGGRLNALWFKPTGKKSEKGVVLFFHGNADNLARWGHLHHFFGRFGYDFFVYDYRGYGKSKGERNQDLMYRDALNVYQTVRQYYPDSQIVLYGRSLGSAFAIRAAAEFPARQLILETPFHSMKDLFYTYYPFLPRAFFMRYTFPSDRYLCRVQMPVAAFQGTEDFIVPFASAERLSACLKPQDRFFSVPGAGHNNLLFYDIYNREMERLLE